MYNITCFTHEDIFYWAFGSGRREGITRFFFVSLIDRHRSLAGGDFVIFVYSPWCYPPLHYLFISKLYTVIYSLYIYTRCSSKISERIHFHTPYCTYRIRYGIVIFECTFFVGFNRLNFTNFQNSADEKKIQFTGYCFRAMSSARPKYIDTYILRVDHNIIAFRCYSG